MAGRDPKELLAENINELRDIMGDLSLLQNQGFQTRYLGFTISLRLQT